MKYILRKFCCNSNLQIAVFIYGVLSAIFSGVLLITTLSTDILKDRRYTYDHVRDHYEYTTGTTPLYYVMVFLSIVHMISSIFLAIAVEKKNVYMMTPWMIVQAITFTPLIPFVVGVLLCFAIVSFPVYVWWAVFSTFVTMKDQTEPQETGLVPPVAATAPSSAVVYTNTFEDIQLPAYKDVVPGGAKYNV